MARMSNMATLTFRNRAASWSTSRPSPPRASRTSSARSSSRPRSAARSRSPNTTRPKAVLLSYAEFEALTKASTPALDDLSDQFDQLLERMQTPQAKSAMASAFDATPEQLGRAAVKAARAEALTRPHGPQGPSATPVRPRGGQRRRQEQRRRRHDPGVRRRLLQPRRGGTEVDRGEPRSRPGEGQRRGVAPGQTAARAGDPGAQGLRVRDHARREHHAAAALRGGVARASRYASGTSDWPAPICISNVSATACAPAATTFRNPASGAAGGTAG